MEVDNGMNPNYSSTQSGVFVTPQQSQAQQPQTSSALGMIVPGGPVRYDFMPVDASGTKWALQLHSPVDLPNPLLVHELVFFFLGAAAGGAAPLPPHLGVMVYWQLQSGREQSGFKLLGSITMDQPSQIFRTGWSEHDQFLSIPPHQPVTVTIGLSIEPIESIRNILSSNNSNGTTFLANSNARRPLVAQKIAQDLYNFMQSFDTGAGASKTNTMTVPTNIFERWWKRFESKSQRDPGFFLKQSV